MHFSGKPVAWFWRNRNPFHHSAFAIMPTSSFLHCPHSTNRTGPLNDLHEEARELRSNAASWPSDVPVASSGVLRSGRLNGQLRGARQVEFSSTEPDERRENHCQGNSELVRTRDGRYLHTMVLPGPRKRSVTVVFEAGAAASRSGWALVQPAVGKMDSRRRLRPFRTGTQCRRCAPAHATADG